MSEQWNGVNVKFDLLPIGTRRTGQSLVGGKPKFAVVHDTGNPNTTAQANVNYYKNTYNIGWNAVASAHIFVDDKECIVCIPVTEKAWHVLYNTPVDNNWYGDDANDIAFGIEICYFDDKERSRKSLDNACRILGYLCKYWKINPKTNMPGHQDIQSDKVDPGNLLHACGYSRNQMSVIDNLVISYMNGTKVSKLNTIKPASKKPAGAKKVSKSVTAPKSVVKGSGWRKNVNGVLWKPETGTVTITADMGVNARIKGGSTKYPVAKVLPKGSKVKYFEKISHDSYIWVAFKDVSGQVLYVATAKSDNKGNFVGTPWAKFSK